MAIKPSIKKDVFNKFLIMELVRNFLAVKVIEKLQLMNFNFLVQFGDITCMNLFICSPPLTSKQRLDFTPIYLICY